MKKKIVMLGFILLIMGVITGFEDAEAFSFSFIDVDGYVNPVNTVITSSNDFTTTFDNLTYTFVVRDTYGGSSSLYVLGLQFESDVFVDQGSYTIASINDGWGINLDAGSGEWYVASTSSNSLTDGEVLSITFDNVELYTAALTSISFDLDGDGVDDGNWSEGQIWAQKWTSLDNSGGSTAPVPEPGTLLLLGFGLVGMGFYRGKKSI